MTTLKKIAAAVCAAACIASVSAAPDDISKLNPYGLVYQGAVKTNTAGKVNIHPVTYSLHGIKIAANVYTPANYDAKQSYPAVVVAHPNGGTKEQVAGLFAQRLAELGYITIAADAAYQGASGGGYTLNAAKSDKRFAAVATISMFNTGLVRRMGYMNSAADTVQERLKAASDAHAAEMLKGEAALSGTVDFDAISPEEAAKIPNDLYREGLEYYGRTHRHPNATFSYTTSSLMDLMTWDATDQIELISVPLLMIAGSKADSLYMTQDAFAKASGTSDKELYEIPGATHIQTYYVPEYVNQEVAKLSEFFGRTLK